MILADTSVWIEHFRAGVPALATELDAGTILMHPFILGELACGNLKHRNEILSLCAQLPRAPVASDAEALELIEQRELMGLGIGYIDVHLLASAVLAGTARMWTFDKRLAAVAADLQLR